MELFKNGEWPDLRPKQHKQIFHQESLSALQAVSIFLHQAKWRMHEPNCIFCYLSIVSINLSWATWYTKHLSNIFVKKKRMIRFQDTLIAWAFTSTWFNSHRLNFKLIFVKFGRNNKPPNPIAYTRSLLGKKIWGQRLGIKIYSWQIHNALESRVIPHPIFVLPCKEATGVQDAGACSNGAEGDDDYGILVWSWTASGPNLISSTDPGPSSNSNDERIARDSYLLHRRRSPVTVGAGPEATTSSDVAPSPVYLARSVTPLYFALMHASQIYNTNKYSTNKKEEEWSVK